MEKTANLGFAQAQFYTASFYCDGVGIKRNNDKCYKWYDAMYNIFIMTALDKELSNLITMQ